MPGLGSGGWVRTGGKESHRKYQASDGRVVVVPVHKSKDLKRGLQVKLMEASGLTDADL